MKNNKTNLKKRSYITITEIFFIIVMLTGIVAMCTAFKTVFYKKNKENTNNTKVEENAPKEYQYLFKKGEYVRHTVCSTKGQTTKDSNPEFTIVNFGIKSQFESVPIKTEMLIPYEEN